METRYPFAQLDWDRTKDGRMAKTTPIEDLETAKEAAARVRKAEELTTLEKWRQSQDPAHLQPLLKAYEPVMANTMRYYKAPGIPEAAFKAEMTSHVINAFQSFNPDRGAALNTHVQNTLRKVYRYNNKYQNHAYIPPDSAKHIGNIDRARATLLDEIGRDPTYNEIADHLGLKPGLVKRIETSRRAAIDDTTLQADPIDQRLARDSEVMSLLPYSLDPKEKEVFEFMYGSRKGEMPKQNGKPSLAALAAKLGMNGSQLSRIHTSILSKYKSYR